MSEDEGSDLFVTTCFCCFHGYLHLFDFLLWDQRKQKRHIDFHLIHFLFHYKFHYKLQPGFYTGPNSIFKTDYSRLACFRVVSQVESSNIVSNTNGCVKCLFDHKTLTMLTQFRSKLFLPGRLKLTHWRCMRYCSILIKAFAAVQDKFSMSSFSL